MVQGGNGPGLAGDGLGGNRLGSGRLPISSHNNGRSKTDSQTRSLMRHCNTTDIENGIYWID